MWRFMSRSVVASSRGHGSRSAKLLAECGGRHARGFASDKGVPGRPLLVTGAGGSGKTLHGVKACVDFLKETSSASSSTKRALGNLRDRVLFVSATQEHSHRVADDIIASVSLTDASRCEFTTPAEYVENIIETLASTAGTAATRPLSRAESLQNVMENLDALRLSEEAAVAGTEVGQRYGELNSTTLSYRPKPSHEVAFCNAFLNYYNDLHGMGVLDGDVVVNAFPEHRCAAADRALAQISATNGALHRPLLRAAQDLAELRLNAGLYQRGSQEAAAFALQLLLHAYSVVPTESSPLGTQDAFGLVVVDDAHLMSITETQLFARSLALHVPRFEVLLNTSQGRHVVDPVRCWEELLTSQSALLGSSTYDRDEVTSSNNFVQTVHVGAASDDSNAAAKGVLSGSIEFAEYPHVDEEKRQIIHRIDKVIANHRPWQPVENGKENGEGDPSRRKDLPGHASVAILCTRSDDIPSMWNRLNSHFQLNDLNCDTSGGAMPTVVLAPLPYHAQRVPPELRFVTSVLHYLAAPHNGGGTYLYDVLTSSMVYGVAGDIIAHLQSPSVRSALERTAGPHAGTDGDDNLTSRPQLGHLMHLFAGLSDVELRSFAEKVPDVDFLLLAVPREGSSSSSLRSWVLDDASETSVTSRLSDARDRMRLAVSDFAAMGKVQGTATASELLALLVERVQDRAGGESQTVTKGAGANRRAPSNDDEEKIPGQPPCELLRLLNPNSATEEASAAVLGQFFRELQRVEERTDVTRAGRGGAGFAASEGGNNACLMAVEARLPQIVQSTLRSLENKQLSEQRQAFDLVVASNTGVLPESGAGDGPQQHHVHVTVLSPWEIGGRTWDYVFFPMAARGRLPRRNVKGPLPPLTNVRDVACQQFASPHQDDDAWWREPDHTQKERARFLSCISRGRRQTFVSSSRCLGGKRTTVPPSPFVLEMLENATIIAGNKR